MIHPKNDGLFSPELWGEPLEKFAGAAHLTVKLFDAQAHSVFGPVHPTPLFELFEDHGYDPGTFIECARRCLASPSERPQVAVLEYHGLAVVGAPLVLEDRVVGAAVGGYVFATFSLVAQIQRIARQGNITFHRLWGIARKQRPVGLQQLQVHGELLQVLGESLLLENCRTRQYEEAAASVRASESQLRTFAQQLEQLVAERTDELMGSQERLRALATELNLTEQRERTRIAAELHDHLQQMLVLGKIKLSQGKRLTDLAPGFADVLRQADNVLTDALAYTRTLVADLSPPVLREFGLSAALKWLVEQMQRHEVLVTVEIEEESKLLLPDDQAILIFQSVRELLINSAKYAKTGRASVKLEQKQDLLCIDVWDDGIGFDVTSAATSTSTPLSSKFGLFSIRERMKALGGQFEISSAPGKGTKATLRLPLTPHMAKAVSSGINLSLQEKPHNSRRPSTPLDSPIVSHVETSRITKLSPQAFIRVLLVDDHAMMREGLRSVLESYADVEVVGEARDGEEAVACVERLQPTIIIMDINMPKMNGIEATAMISTRWPNIRVIGLSVNPSGHNAEAMVAAGAAMLLTKEGAVEELYRAIQRTILPLVPPESAAELH
jgi:signal transduction histidine kinase/ActR/RegA family two-component response regulator